MVFNFFDESSVFAFPGNCFSFLSFPKKNLDPDVQYSKVLQNTTVQECKEHCCLTRCCTVVLMLSVQALSSKLPEALQLHWRPKRFFSKLWLD